MSRHREPVITVSIGAIGRMVYGVPMVIVGACVVTQDDDGRYRARWVAEGVEVSLPVTETQARRIEKAQGEEE